MNKLLIRLLPTEVEWFTVEELTNREEGLWTLTSDKPEILIAKERGNNPNSIEVVIGFIELTYSATELSIMKYKKSSWEFAAEHIPHEDILAISLLPTFSIAYGD